MIKQPIYAWNCYENNKKLSELVPGQNSNGVFLICQSDAYNANLVQKARLLFSEIKWFKK
jgi:hypothetical protein